MRIACWGLMILLAAPAGAALAQPQQDQAPAQQQTQDQKPDPLAEAARHAREQKKDQAKAAKVWDNDTIPEVGGTINVVGQAGTPPAPDAGATPAPGDQSNANAATPNGAPANPANAQANSATSADLDAAKAQLESLQKDLDLMQRQFDLDQQTWLSKPEHEQDREGAASLKIQQDRITAKQQEVADAQKKVADLQQKLGTSGGSGTKQ
jgi:hypothetical protein